MMKRYPCSWLDARWLVCWLCASLFWLQCSRNRPCEGPERFCEGNVLWVCVGDRTGWWKIPCGLQEVCIQGECRPGIKPVGDAGNPTDTGGPDAEPQTGELCFDNTPRCAERTARWLCVQERWQKQPCDVGKICQHGVCEREVFCQDGTRRCRSLNEVEVCFQGQWQSLTCDAGKRCQSGVCEDEPLCQDREVRCAEPYVVETCVSGKWQRQRCDVGMYCQQGKCVPQQAACRDGDARCFDQGNQETCQQGMWSRQPCAAGMRCENNQCAPLVACGQDERRCLSLQEEQRCVQGVWQTKTCTQGQQCQKDGCVTLTSGTCINPCGSKQICQNGQCSSWPVTYRSVPFLGQKTDRDPPQHADLNLKLRGWQLIAGQSQSLVTYAGPTDMDPPKLFDMFVNKAFPGILNNYQVGAWDWASNSKQGWISSTPWKVHLVGLRTQPGEVLSIPSRKSDIYQGWAQALVLYLDQDSITFVYTREDTVANGYAVHISGVNLAVDLTLLYQTLSSRSKQELPALGNNQPFATAIGNEIKMAIRDRGQFMDPRSQKDWW